MRARDSAPPRGVRGAAAEFRATRRFHLDLATRAWTPWSWLPCSSGGVAVDCSSRTASAHGSGTASVAWAPPPTLAGLGIDMPAVAPATCRASCVPRHLFP
jgi:hypothetical protein